MRTVCFLLWIAAAFVALTNGCSDESTEPASVSLTVIVDGSLIEPVTTDLGYEVTVSTIRMVVHWIAFTTAGETHANNQRNLLKRLLIGEAYAHPGHYAGGEVIGELSGRYVLDWINNDGQTLGSATLLEGDYNGANFTFTTGSESDGLTGEDSLVGHCIEIGGIATQDDTTVTFHSVIDQDEDRQVVGATFELDVTAETTATLAVQFVAHDLNSSDTIFDGIEFADLVGENETVEIQPDSEAYNIIRRHLQYHEYYYVQAQ